MNFPSLQSATDYIQSKIQDLYNQRGVLMRRLQQIAALKDAAMKTNNQQALGQLIVMRQGVIDLLNEQSAMEDRLKPFADYFGISMWQMPLGALPLILAGVAIAVATSMFLYYEKLQNQKQALDMIAKGILPADQADAILNPGFFSGIGGSFAQVGIFAVGGIFLYLFLTSRRAA